MENGDAPAWRLHTALWKFAEKISTNISWLGKRRGLKLEEVSSLPVLISYNITISLLNPLNSFRFIFSLRDSQDDLLEPRKSLGNIYVYDRVLNANLNIKVRSSILVCMINFSRLLRCYMVHFRLIRNQYVETVSFQPIAWHVGVTDLRAWKREARASVCDLTNWRQFLCVCPIIDHEFRHYNIVKVVVDLQTTLTTLCGNSPSITGPVARNWRQFVFLTTNCQIVGSRSLPQRIKYKFTRLSGYWR